MKNIKHKKQKKDGLLIYGQNVIFELLNSQKDNILEFYLLSTKEIKESLTSKIKEISNKYKIKINHVDKNFFIKNFGENINHQGIVAKIKSFQYKDFTQWQEESKQKEKELVLLLDKIEDVGNFGAIIRTAAAVGVSTIFVPSFGQAPMNEAVFKTSAGNIFKIDIIEVSNINNTIKKLKELKFWIYGLDMSQKKENNIFNQEFDKKTVLVLGSEGRGVSEKTLEKCDFISSIPMENDVESLNVSVSAALIMYQWKKQYF